MKIKKDDQILVIAGKDKGRKGKVIQVLTKQGRVIIDGVNIMKKHVRPKKSGEKGQTIERPGPINISNVKLLCLKCSKPTRAGYKIEGKNKHRICKKCNREL